MRNLCCVLSRAGYSANSFANFANSANYSNSNTVVKQSEVLPAVVAKSLDEWVERTREKMTPTCFPCLHREAWIHVFKKYNTTVPRSTAVERVFSVGSDILRPKRASLTAEYFKCFVLLRENEKCFPQSLFLRK